ncbi:Rieske (2Fe-2S) protein [Marinomonas sp. THO17]|uniref:Rieske (2Fe-2S) protein n=1 Tax=Marinomonas sp. THO17 TaxID=3149048 RepID=UPI00336BE9C5
MNTLADKIALCHVDDVGERETKGFLAGSEGQDLLFLVKIEGELYGWKNSCPHIDGAPMAWKKDAYINSEKTHLTCFAHGALFEPETGLCVQGPCLGKKLEPVTVYVDELGRVFMCDLENKNKES